MHVLLAYILPFAMLALLLAAVTLKIHWFGGPAGLAVVFFVIAFGPSLVYALLADDSSAVLFGGSVAAALAACGILYARLHHK